MAHKDVKIRKNKRNRSRQKKKEIRKANTSSSNVAKRAKLNSKDRKDSMKRLGISNELGKKALPPSSVEDEKQRIQGFLDQFFQSEANAGKFTEGEKRKFANNFKKAFIESKLGNNPIPKAPTSNKLKALPAPPVVKKVVEQKLPSKKKALPALPQKHVREEPINEENEQRIGNVKMYGNMFSNNNFNFMSNDPTVQSESQYDDTQSNLRESHNFETSDKRNSRDMERKSSNDSDNGPIRMNFNYAQRMAQESNDYLYNQQLKKEPIPQTTQKFEKVSSTFGESLPMLASFVNLYGKSFANARK